jgi:hypothetical protein
VTMKWIEGSACAAAKIGSAAVCQLVQVLLE